MLLCLGACLDPGDYPSLKPRPFEVAARDAGLPPPAPPAAPARAEIVAHAAALLAKGESGQRAFAAELAASRAAVARAGAPDSESWIAAHQQLSGLDASRVDTVTAIADLDALTLAGADETGVTLGEADLAVLRSTGDQLGALLDGQQSEIARLAASLAAPSGAAQ